MTQLHGEQVPYAGHDEKPECRPSDELEPTRDGAGRLAAAEPANRRYDARERDLSAHPYRRAEDMQEQPNRRAMYRQHDAASLFGEASEPAFDVVDVVQRVVQC